MLNRINHKVMPNKINIDEKLNTFHDHWNPRIIGELNDQHVGRIYLA